ncbi:hypothetical protein CLV57_1952 [Mucilaginibacter auburnensis]|uniref:Luciferase domain-containing protein n=1 Tax=Mucilaginibacter auburnensis TaxID=1457233 RepID=A0A2H9VVT7_9SPHI|nr:hypothetical protein CLV57_1952 [Mucilaginibacter auburnensis]
MFNFVVKYLGFLKHVPGLALLFDVLLKVITLFTNPELLDLIDEIELEVQQWPGVSKKLHKYGGVQFDLKEIEIGHIHGNGLLDMILNRDFKRQLISDGKIRDHHTFRKSGWISFHIKTESDKDYAIQLLKIGYALKSKRTLNSPGGYHQIPLAAIVPVFAKVNALPNAQCQSAIADGYSNRSAQH